MKDIVEVGNRRGLEDSEELGDDIAGDFIEYR